TERQWKRMQVAQEDRYWRASIRARCGRDFTVSSTSSSMSGHPSRVVRMRATDGACISQEWGEAGSGVVVKPAFTPIFSQGLARRLRDRDPAKKGQGPCRTGQEPVEIDSSRFSRGGSDSSPLTRNQT